MTVLSWLSYVIEIPGWASAASPSPRPVDPGVTPNSNGLPGLPVLQQIVGALLTWGLLACVAGLVVSIIIWALGHHQGNYMHTTSAKTGVLVSAGGALLIGGANAIVGFFATLGGRIKP